MGSNGTEASERDREKKERAKYNGKKSCGKTGNSDSGNEDDRRFARTTNEQRITNAHIAVTLGYDRHIAKSLM